ncbi:MAG TPA: DUF4983 domain-containing protein [Chitinophagaceae bacterium]|nr:DUF4983 domain-containing protein [Chitinophagaceae bacterium]
MRKNLGLGFGIALLSVLFFACNQDYPNLLQNVGNDSISVHGNTPKVLYIMVTGANGLVTQDANTPTLDDMAKHSIYTYNGVGDYRKAFDTFSVTNAWANMLTGVSQAKTNADTIWSENKLDQYPTFISRLKKSNPDWKTTALVSSDALKDKFLSDASVAKSFAQDDKATVDAVISELETDQEVKVLVTQLSGVEQVGEQYGYTSNTPQYVNAIEKADAQIGKIIDALRSRENYNHEKWLVVVASGKGGSQILSTTPDAGATAYDDVRRNTFVMFYNPGFQDFYVPKPANTSGAGPFKGKTVELSGNPDGGDGINAIVDVPNDTIYNPGDGAMTIELKVKFDKNNTSSNAPFIGKGQRSGSNPGWILRTNGNKSVTAYVADAAGTKHISINSSVELFDNNWHTIALSIWKIGGNVNMKLFVDNVKIGYKYETFPDGSKIGSTRNLQFGYNPTTWGDPNIINITDVRIWKTNLSDDIIKEYSCVPGLPPSTHPNINKLIGFWPCRDGSGKVFKDLIQGNDAQLNPQGSAKIEWQSFNDVSMNVCPAPAPAYYRMVPNSVDIPYEIFQWLGVNVPTEWNLDGKAWVAGYTDVTNPIY